MKTTNEYLQPVLDWLEAGAPHKTTGFGFNMGHFNLNDHTCGTVCCIAGAVQQFNKLPEPNTGDAIEDCRVIAKAIGLTAEQASVLFMADGYCHSSHEFMADVPPEEAARTLRRFMETGEIEWD